MADGGGEGGGGGGRARGGQAGEDVARLGGVAELNEGLETDDPDPEQKAMEASDRRVLLDATRKLPLPQRQVIVLVLEGFEYGEIAQMLDIAPNALALRLSRAKAALKAIMEQAR